MRILISGSTGLVGSSFFHHARKQGHDVVRLVRSVGESSGSDIIWNPDTGATETLRFEGFDAVVHLAGDSIASGRWTAKKKELIRASRVNGTKNLSLLLAGLHRPPKVFVVASAIGFYGDRGAEVLDEQSPAGSGFLPDVCQAWEAATLPASQKGIRTANLRFGIILSSAGGALKTMLLPFKLGVGGIIGDGQQFMSWVALEDIVGVIDKVIDDESLSGPINVVAAEAVTNQAFTDSLGEAMQRPTLLPMPAFAARLAFGEMADALLLSSSRVVPKKLTAAGYKFRFTDLKSCLKDLLPR